MLLGYETRKIGKRITPWLCLIFLFAVAAITTIITATGFNKPDPAPNHHAEYTALQERINTWDTAALNVTANDFAAFYQTYCDLNTATSQEESLFLRVYAEQAYPAFNYFYNWQYKNVFVDSDKNITDYWLVKAAWLNSFDEVMEILATDLFNRPTYPDKETLIAALAVNTRWHAATLAQILGSIKVQNLQADDLTELRAFFTAHPDYSEPAYQYAWNRYALAVDTGTDFPGQLADYLGFEHYQSAFVATGNLALSTKALDNPDTHYASAYTFGQIRHDNRVDLLAFAYTNLEMAGIPLLILVIIFTACAFFTDNYQHTVLWPLTCTGNRRRVLWAKLGAVLLWSISALVVLVLLYLLLGLIFFQATIAPSVLFLLNGQTAVALPQVVYFLLYLASFVLKALPFIAVCGLLSLARTDPRLIVAFSLLTIAGMTLANALLGGFYFYQFVPLLALNLFGYFGATGLAAPMPPSFNFWYTGPVLVVVVSLLYFGFCYQWRKHDFK